jgi:hypothetical protein
MVNILQLVLKKSPRHCKNIAIKPQTLIGMYSSIQCNMIQFSRYLINTNIITRANSARWDCFFFNTLYKSSKSLPLGLCFPRLILVLITYQKMLSLLLYTTHILLNNINFGSSFFYINGSFIFIIYVIGL